MIVEKYIKARYKIVNYKVRWRCKCEVIWDWFDLKSFDCFQLICGKFGWFMSDIDGILNMKKGLKCYERFEVKMKCLIWVRWIKM